MPLSSRRHIGNLCVLVLALLGDPVSMLAAERFPQTEWERADPGQSGWAKDKLQKAEAWSKEIKSTAVMVVHRGVVVAEWGDVAAKTPLASVRKSLLSALIGNAQAAARSISRRRSALSASTTMNRRSHPKKRARR